MHPSALPVEALLAECDERRLRRSGPGGQHRNKVETAVVLTHRPTGVSAEANERRSQQQNREAATHRLRLRLAVAHRKPWGGSPTDRWRARLGGARLAINPANEAFPALLAEALDAVAASSWDEASAAQQLGVSRSRLLKFLAIEAEGLAVLNRHRAGRGLKPLS